MEQLVCKNLCVGYEGRAVREGLNFTVNEGDYLCIIGENGSGKSTLLKTLLGLLPPISGSAELCGGLTKRDVGYLPQQSPVQKDFPASVTEVVLSGNQGHCGLRPYYTADEKRRARENIQRMGMENLAKRSYRSLSGGQQQRVLLARALCAADKLLLLDEPVTGLDPKATEEMYALIEKLNREGVTIIMISHDMDAALKYASHILALGKTVYFGTKQGYLQGGERRA